MELRVAGEQDLEGLRKLLLQVNQIHADGRPDLFKAGGIKYTDSELQDILRSSRYAVHVAAEGGRVLGYVFCIFEETKETTSLRPVKTLYIDDLCVDEDARGRGIGRKLYDRAVEIAREHGCDRVTLHAWNFNKSAYGFYEKLGMTPLVTTLEQRLKP